MKHLGSTLETPALLLASQDLAGTLSAKLHYVNHGSNASMARPTTSAPVVWQGSVEPLNAVNGDYWWE
jgi:hypothetical protein